MSEEKFTSETREEYESDANRYFRNVGSPRNPGFSADEAKVADKYLPSKEKEQQNLDRLTKGFQKTSRSGAFVNRATAVPGIFPNGLKFASDFIEEMTPGKMQREAVVRPPDRQKAWLPSIPKAEVVLEDLCPDCMKPIDATNYVLGIYPITIRDQNKLQAMGVKFGSFVNYTVCKPCWDYAQVMGKDATPIALVTEGSLIPMKEIELARKYNRPIALHDGNEKTLGQWYIARRQERVLSNLDQMLIDKHGKKVNDK
jgi:hypothetical protein